jgi:predicted Zn-dependent protease
MTWGEFTLKDEKELGEKFNVLVRSRMPLVEDSEIKDYVTDIVNRMARNMPPQPFPFTVSVVQDNAVNAFACPGGYIFVYTGLLLAMRKESEVAGVIAHEMGHVTQRHIARRIENSQLVGILSVLGALAGAFLGGQGGPAAITGALAAGQAAMLGYSRADERESDQVGMSYLTRAGYSPQGMVGAFEILSRKQWLTGREIPSYLSTHPGLTERVQDMKARISLMTAGQQNRQEDNARFLRVQTLVRARYGDPQPAEIFFADRLQGPNRCMALMGRGILASRQNRVNDASSAFAEALACAPDEELIIREAGRFHYTKGDRNKGAALLQRAVSINKNDIFALFYHARSLADSNKNNEAVEYMKDVLRKVPEDSEVHDAMAHIYGKSGRMFLANLHMAYSALYANRENRIKQFMDKAGALAKTPEEKNALARFEKRYNDRKQFWK